MANKARTNRKRGFVPFDIPRMFGSASDPSREYETSIDTVSSAKEGKVRCSCNCRGWTMKKKAAINPLGIRQCRHTKQVEADLLAGRVVVPQDAINDWANVIGGGIQPDANLAMVPINSGVMFATMTQAVPSSTKTASKAKAPPVRMVMCTGCDHRMEWGGRTVQECNECADMFLCVNG